jgi:hypothetical protein
MANREWTIQRNGQHWLHKTQDEDKANKNTTQYVFDTTSPGKTTDGWFSNTLDIITQHFSMSLQGHQHFSKRISLVVAFKFLMIALCPCYIYIYFFLCFCLHIALKKRGGYRTSHEEILQVYKYVVSY